MDVNTVYFEIVYDGPMLDDNTMDIRDLAPALMAIGDLFQNANAIINHDKCTIAVNVKAGFKKGSFGVGIETQQTLLATAITLFSQDPITAAANIATIIGFIKDSGVSFLQLVKRVGGKRIESVKDNRNGTLEIKIEGDSNNLTVNNNVYQLYGDLPTRLAAQKMVGPLNREGIEHIMSVQSGEVVESISKDEKGFFNYLQEGEKLIETKEEETWLAIHSIIFGSDKWRFTEGGRNTFWAKISDKSFLNEVIKAERSFSNGDLLRVRLKKTFYQTMEGIRTDYEIIQLLEHKEALRQLNLPLPS